MSDSNPDSSPLNGVSNNASEELQKEVPQLKFLGLTPLASIQQESKPTPSQKRPLLALSPAGETEEKQELQNTIQEGIKEAINDIFPSLIDKLKTDLKSTINEIVEEKFQKFVEESKTVWRRVIDERIAELETMLTQTSERMIASKISETTTDIHRRTDEKLARFITEIGTTTNSEDTVTDLKMLSQTELLETYNRRDNVKVFGLSETIDENGNTETNAQTAQAFLDVTADLNVNVDATDISIAHRLSSRYKNRPIIVKFTRRIKKIEVLKNKRALEESPSFYNVTILEDASKPRLNFLKLMKGDERISSSFIRDGVIHYRWMDGKMYRINNFFEGGLFLNYSLINIQQCFKPPQNPDTERTNQPFRET